MSLRASGSARAHALVFKAADNTAKYCTGMGFTASRGDLAGYGRFSLTSLAWEIYLNRVYCQAGVKLMSGCGC